MVGPQRLVVAAVLLSALAACGESTSSSSSSSGTTVGSAGANLGTAAVKIATSDGLKFDPAQQTAKLGDLDDAAPAADVHAPPRFGGLDVEDLGAAGAGVDDDLHPVTLHRSMVEERAHAE